MIVRYFEETLPLSVVDHESEEGSLVVRFEWNPGTPETGRTGGPPEDYDPGSADEFVIRSASYDTSPGIPVYLSPVEDERVTDWLDENFERPDPGPDPDDERDRRRDEDLLS